jgi:predicted FMN-binding regulatory protein PaiB
MPFVKKIHAIHTSGAIFAAPFLLLHISAYVVDGSEVLRLHASHVAYLAYVTSEAEQPCYVSINGTQSLVSPRWMA